MLVSNEGDKRAPVASVGITRGMQQLRKAQVWVVDHRTTQLLMSGVMAYSH